jgi:hypothetical protein
MKTFLAGKSRRLYKIPICVVILILRCCDVPRQYDSLLRISKALYLSIFEKPAKELSHCCVRQKYASLFGSCALDLTVFEQTAK